ncbi:MAG: hypothetical protein ACRDT4_18575, partial [Micromonosporaceae bacterium]
MSAGSASGAASGAAGAGGSGVAGSGAAASGAAGTAGGGAGGGREPRVLVLAGGLSYEREVSLRSGRRVLTALRQAGVETELRDADATLLPTLAADPPDAVVIALHG